MLASIMNIFFILTIFITLFYSLSLGLEFFIIFILGCAVTTILIRHKYIFTIFIEKIQKLLGCKEVSVSFTFTLQH